MVAQLPHLRLHRVLPVHLLHPLLRHQAEHLWLCVHAALLRLHHHHGVLVLPPHRNNRLLRVLLVRSEDLQCGESGLAGLGCLADDGSLRSITTKLETYVYK